MKALDLLYMLYLSLIHIFTSSNINLSMDEVDNILDYWGLYHDSEHLSAEHELIHIVSAGSCILWMAS